jgi:hypothetical protein
VNSTLPAPMIVTFGMRDIVPSGPQSNKFDTGRRGTRYMTAS